MEQKKELDLKMVKLVQENSEQNKKLREIKEQEQIEKELKKAFENLSDNEINKLIDGFYSQSIQDDSNHKKQEIHGKTYVDKNKMVENIKVIGTAAILVASIVITGKVISTMNLVSTYNDIMNEKIEAELNQGQKNAYEDRHKNPITSAIEHYQNIQEAKNDLKATGNYNFWGDNIKDPDKEYTEYEIDDINLTNITEDAIEIATDKEIDESKKTESWGRTNGR